MANVGVASVTITAVPAPGIGRAMGKQLVPEGKKAGEQAGDAIGDAAADAAKKGGRRAGEELADGVKKGGQKAGDEAGEGIATGIERSGGRLKGAVGNVLGAGSAVAGRVTALAGALGAGGGLALGAAFSSALDAGKATAKLNAQLGLTATESARIGRVAGNLFAANYGESMGDVTTAIRSVVADMGGMRTASAAALQTTTGRALDLAEIMETDVGGVTRAVGQLMRTGLVKNSSEAFDILTKGFQNGADKAGDLLDTVNEYGTQFRDLGLTGKQAMGLLSQGLRAGARDSDVVADALKEFAIRAKDGSDEVSAGFKKIGLDGDKMAQVFSKGGPNAAKALDTVLDRLRAVKDPAKRSQLAVQLFGTQAEDLQQSLFALDLSKVGKDMDGVKGAADRANTALRDNAADRASAAFRTLSTNLSTALAPAAASVANWVGRNLVPALRDAVTWAQRNEGTVKAIAIALGIAAGAFVTYKVAVTTASAAQKTWAAGKAVVGGVTATKNAIGGLVTGFRNVNAAFASNASFSTRVGAALRSQGMAWRQQAASAWTSTRATIANTAAAARQRIGQAATALRAQGAAWRAQAAATASSTRASIANTAASVRQRVAAIASTITTRAITIATRGWAIAQRLLNLAMRANPIGIVITVLALLVGAVIAAYNKSETFRRIVQAAWRGIQTAASYAWNNVIKPVFRALGNGVEAVRKGFKIGFDAIARILGGLRDAAKKPINFVIGVYNRGVVDLVNKIASFAGLKIRLGRIPQLARGGTLDNPAPAVPMMTNGPMAVVGEGRKQYPEYVIPTDPRYARRAQGLWAAAGQKLAGDRRWLSGPNALAGEGLAYERGGVLPQMLASGGVIGNFLRGVKDFTIGNMGRAAKSVLNHVLGGALPGAGIFRDVIAGIPKWIVGKLTSWISSKAAGGGPGAQRALAWARAQSGKPYIWGGVGPAGFDCSGFMSAITNVIKGRRPNSRLFTTHSFGASGGPGGFVRNLSSAFRVGVTNAGVGHMAGTLNGVPVESSGSRGVRVGGGARGYNNSLFGYRYGLKFDSGGVWEPGVLGINKTRSPEAVFTDAQWGLMRRAVEPLVTPMRGERPVNLTVNKADGISTERELELLARRAGRMIPAYM